MALLRLTRSHETAEGKREDEIIINTQQITIVYQDLEERGVWIQLTHGEPVLIKLTFEEIWTLIQRET